MGCLVVIGVFGALFLFLFVSVGGIVGSPALAMVITVAIVGLCIYANCTQNKPIKPCTPIQRPDNKSKNAKSTLPMEKPKPVFDFGKYHEHLPSGGELVVSLKDYYIQYAFPGPDRRYKWTYVAIKRSQITQFKYAWFDNFQVYLALKCKLPQNSTSIKEGLCGMQIHVNDPFDGVCLTGWHMPINSQAALSQVIIDYNSAFTRATEIRRLLGDPESENKLREQFMTLLNRILINKQSC